MTPYRWLDLPIGCWLLVTSFNKRHPLGTLKLVFRFQRVNMNSYYSSEERFERMIREDPISTLVGLAIAVVIYFLFLWFLYSRFGYRGKARLFLALTSLFPAFFAFDLLIVSLISSPNEIELKRLKKQVNSRI